MALRPSLEMRIAVALVAACGVTFGLAAFGWWLGLPVWAMIAWLAGVCIACAWKLPAAILRPLASLANMLDALHGGDYAQRLRTDRGGIAGELASGANRLSESLRQHSRTEREADALLGKLLHEIDLAIFTFDRNGRLVLANPAARRLVGVRLGAGVDARALKMDRLLAEDLSAPVRLVFPGGSGRFLVRRRPFRIEGRAHTLLVLTNAEAALVAERREAWQSLVRVLGHEINNSLAPIQSIATSLADSVAEAGAQPTGGGVVAQAEWIDHLKLIAGRADALGRFVAGYAALARLPEPKIQTLELSALIQNVVEMETRLPVRVSGPAIEIQADPDQLEQALINLVKNAVDAVELQRGTVDLQWQTQSVGVVIEVSDDGAGPPDSDNLFVPFFTTKPGGSGIGLLLARRIAELHGGELNLNRRTDGPGAVARLWLPVRPGESGSTRPESPTSSNPPCR